MAFVSRRELVLMSAAAGALGGGLVALAFAAGPPRSQPRHFAAEEIHGFSWVKRRFLRLFSLQLEGEDAGVSCDPPTSSSLSSKPTCMQGNGCASSKSHTSQQTHFFSVENGEVEGSEDVRSDLKVGDMDNIIDQPALALPQIFPKADPYNPSKRQGYMSWDDYFMAIAFLSARRSKDPNRQVGACIVSQDRVILGIGYNGFPRGCADDLLPWAKKSASGDPLQTKYPYVCHAEVNAILNKNHASASGQRLYVTLFPCNECAKMIIQAGIAEVVYYTGKGAHVENDAGSTEPAYLASQKLLSMAGIKVWQHQPTDKLLVLEFR